MGLGKDRSFIALAFQGEERKTKGLVLIFRRAVRQGKEGVAYSPYSIWLRPIGSEEGEQRFFPG